MNSAFSTRVASSADDGLDDGTTYSVDQGYILAGQIAGVRQHHWMRFDVSGIGATIAKATLTIYGDGTGISGAPRIVFYLDKQQSPAAPTSGQLASRTRTTASTTWEPASIVTNDPYEIDITAQLREVIAAVGVPTAVMVILDGDDIDSGDNYAGVRDYDGDIVGAVRPKLVIATQIPDPRPLKTPVFRR